MLIGRYYHTLESKNRVSLPKSLRQDSQDWVVTRGLDGGLFVFPANRFASELEKLATSTFTSKRHRDLVRLLTNDAFETSPDKAGRISLPEHLTELAGLVKNLVIVGSFTRVEIWDRDKYHHYLDSVDTAEDLVESLPNAA